MRTILLLTTMVFIGISCHFGPYNEDKVEYVVVFKMEDGKSLAPWQEEVLELLDVKYPKAHVTPLYWKKNIEEIHRDLSGLMPKYTVFVLSPGEGGRDFTKRISRMCRRLNQDPYLDTFWGVLTGFTHQDIINLAQYDHALEIERALDATGSVNLSIFKEAYSFNESARKEITYQQYDKKQIIPTDYDSTDSFCQVLTDKKPQVIMTSAHATENDWCMGYPDANSNMILRSINGNMIATNLKKETLSLSSSEPKIWIAAGNCLIGNVPDTTNCMVNAAIHCLGVKQFVGYTVVTWFGEQGWGTLGKFTTPAGFYSLNEAFHFANQDILRKLKADHERYMDLPFGDASHSGFKRSMTRLYQKNPKISQQTVGRIFDRDVVAFYGDPAVGIKMANTKPKYKVIQSISPKSALIKISKSKNEVWPNDGLYVAFESTLNAPQIETQLSDSSIWNQRFIFLAPEDLKGETISVKFNTSPFRNALHFSNLKDYDATEFSANSDYVAQIESDFNRFLFNIGQKKANKIIALLENVQSPKIQFYVRFLLTRMPKSDFKALNMDRIIQNATYAHYARENAPWKETLTDDLFLRYVLPDWVLDERRDAWRKSFYDQFSDTAFKCASISDAIKYLNSSVYETYGVTYHATKRPKPNQSSMESIEAKYASCTGLSIMLIDACRAVGIPARMVGCPLWTDRSGNHNWVEFYDGQWIYEGASLSDPRQRDWVGDMVTKKTNPQKKENTVWATTTENQNGNYFIQVWNPRDPSYPAIPITETYTDSTKVNIQIPSVFGYEKFNFYIYAKNEPVYSKKVLSEEKLSLYLPPALGPYTFYITDDEQHRLLYKW